MKTINLYEGDHLVAIYDITGKETVGEIMAFIELQQKLGRRAEITED